MNAQLNYTVAQHRSAELRRAGERARIAPEAPARRRRLRDQNAITRQSIALEVERAIGGAP